MEDTYEAVLRWPHTDANEVIVSGDFDQWSNSIHLAKDESGFAVTVRIPWGTTVEYKFLVDGQWQTSDAPTQTDPTGKFMNNVFTAPPKPASGVSSTISCVASGLGGTFQSLTGVDTMNVGKESAPMETSIKDIASTETSTMPTPSEAPAAMEAASTVPIPVVPVTDAAHDLDAPLSSSAADTSPVTLSKESEQSAPEPAAAPTTAEFEQNPATTGLEPTVVPTEPEPEQAAPLGGTAPAAPEEEQIVTPPVQQLEQVTAPIAPEAERVAAAAASEPEQAAAPEPNQIVVTSPEPQQVTPVTSGPEQTEAPAVLEPKPVAASESEPIAAPAASEAEQVTPVASEPEKIDAPAVPEPEASTHAPVTFSSRAVSSKGAANGNGTPVPPAPSASESAAAAAQDKTETSAGPSNPTSPLPTSPESDDNATTNEKPLPTENGKHAFPGLEKDEGDGISSKTGSSSVRKIRHSIFGGSSKRDGGDSSKYGSAPRKKTRSFFGKMKQLFDHKN